MARSERASVQSAASVLDVVSSSASPVGWRQLMAALGVEKGGERRQLRLLVKGLLRSGELSQDHQGYYYIEGAGEPLEGTVEARGNQLFVCGHVVARGGRSRLRRGDVARGVLVQGEARVQEVVERSPRELIGELVWHGRYPYVESLDPDVRGRVGLIDPPAMGGPGDSVAVRVVDEDRRGLTGYVVRVIEADNVLERARETLLTAHSIPREWPEGAMRDARKLPKDPGEVERPDLRSLPLVTIDGETAKDFDDAVFAERTDEGWRLVVAIADVAHYVKPGSALDQVARERGNSVYLPELVVPMLPEALSNGLCSLKPHVPRLALVCDMRMHRDGTVAGFEFCEATICSQARLTYTRVAALLGGADEALPQTVANSLFALRDVFDALLKARERRGGLEFDTHECALEITEGRVTAIRPSERNVAHRMIEEAMIAANVCAARYLEAHETPGMYRVHDVPEEGKQKELRDVFAAAGVRLGTAGLTPQTAQKALKQLEDRPNAWVFQQVMLRAMQQAVYSPDNRGHFGLALERYMHFTSPIRRYADLLVHRAIKAVLRGKRSKLSVEALDEIGVAISATERRAEAVGWGVDGWLKCDYLTRHIGEVFDGVVVTATDFGLFLELQGFYVQGLLHVSALGEDHFAYHRPTMSLVGERSGKRFGLGDKLPVRLTEVRPARGFIDLELANPVGSARRRRGRRR